MVTSVVGPVAPPVSRGCACSPELGGSHDRHHPVRRRSLGITGHPVSVEVHVGNGLPGYHMVGLPDVACRESRDRVRAAILSSGLRWPDTRITVNLAPASVRKGGSGLDVAIAIGVLIATEQLDPSLVERIGVHRRARPRRQRASGRRRRATGRLPCRAPAVVGSGVELARGVGRRRGARCGSRASLAELLGVAAVGVVARSTRPDGATTSPTLAGSRPTCAASPRREWRSRSRRPAPIICSSSARRDPARR